jgi:hypothetical protein
MARIKRGFVGQSLECLEALVHRAGIAAGQIDPATAVEKKRVAGDQMAGLVLLFAVPRDSLRPGGSFSASFEALAPPNRS